MLKQMISIPLLAVGMSVQADEFMSADNARVTMGLANSACNAVTNPLDNRTCIVEYLINEQRITDGNTLTALVNLPVGTPPVGAAGNTGEQGTEAPPK